MRKKLFLLPLFLLLLLCSSQAQQKPRYQFPDDIADTAKKTFVKQFNEGFALYKVGCAKCHNKQVKGKEVIPDFSLPQLMDYEIRIFPEHNEKLTDEKITDEEMLKIVHFLRYKEKNPVPVPVAPLNSTSHAFFLLMLYTVLWK